MLGMSLGPVTGKLISELVRGERADVEFLGAGRFETIGKRLI
jgi:glycine/D-amino acid oxidase-like deaminating enzyme